MWTWTRNTNGRHLVNLAHAERLRLVSGQDGWWVVADMVRGGSVSLFWSADREQAEDWMLSIGDRLMAHFSVMSVALD